MVDMDAILWWLSLVWKEVCRRRTHTQCRCQGRTMVRMGIWMAILWWLLWIRKEVC